MLGDISYSVYLWHWPVVVIAPFALGGPLGLVEKVTLVAAVLVAATLTKTFVEDPARRSRFLVASMPRSFALALTSVLVLCGGGVAVIQQGKATQAAQAQALERRLADGDCVGAAALRDPACSSITGDDLLSSPVVAKDDREAMHRDGCFTGIPFTKRNTLRLAGQRGPGRAPRQLPRGALGTGAPAGGGGPRLAPRHVPRVPVLHPGQAHLLHARRGRRQLRGLEPVGARVDHPRWLRPRRHEQPHLAPSCRAVPKGDRDRVAEEGYRDTLRAITDSGGRVLVIRDNPAAIQQAPDCVASHLEDVAACSNAAATAIEADPLYAAAGKDRSGLVSTLDLTDRFCRDDRCYHVIGDLIAYRDHGHLTTAYARTLTPDVEPAVDEALARRAT